MDSVAYVINSTPAYYYLLVPHLVLLKRYNPEFKWPIFIGTEDPENEHIKRCVDLFGVYLIELDKNKCEDSFWESRVATVERLPSYIKYVIPVQEDFLMERPGIGFKHIERVLDAMGGEENIVSARLMPCPGPKCVDPILPGWAVLGSTDEYLFTFQATLWRREWYTKYLENIIEYAKKRFPSLVQGSREWNKMAVGTNIAENMEGRMVFKKLFEHTIHLAWIRYDSRPNAVYECPFPYRPTAVVKGVLQPWAMELLDRENIKWDL